jgi:transcriptional regulator with XRE-family HTH domain
MNALKLARLLKGISQAQLAKEAGLDAAILSRLETDSYRETPAVQSWRKKIAEVLATPVETLFPDSKKAEKEI